MPQNIIPQRMSRRYILSQCLSSLSISESDSVMGLVFKPFGVAVGVEDVHGALLTAVEDGVDGELAGYVFHLAAGEVICRCQSSAFRLRQ